MLADAIPGNSKMHNMQVVFRIAAPKAFEMISNNETKATQIFVPTGWTRSTRLRLRS